LFQITLALQFIWKSLHFRQVYDKIILKWGFIMSDKKYKDTITAKGIDITVISVGNDDDYISLSDIAKFKQREFPSEAITSWMKSRDTVEFLGLWERLHNPNFNSIEFDRIEKEAGKNRFIITPKKWIEITNAIGMTSTQGRYAQTLAHKDIAFEFASWISAEFKLYLIKDYQRLKEDENSKISLDWNIKRVLTKVNYKFHTDAIKENLLPPELTPRQKSFVYADEADLLNVALFGKTAKQWRVENEEKKGNMRDYATVEQLLVLANLETANGLLIGEGMEQSDRITRLNNMARTQLQALIDMKQANPLRLKDNSQE